MKTLFTIFTCLVGFILLSFESQKSYNPSKPVRLQTGDTIEFQFTVPPEPNLFQVSHQRGNYDGKRFTITNNTMGHVKISQLRDSWVKCSSELNVLFSNGKAMMHQDTMVIEAKAVHEKFYLVNLKSGLLDSFTRKLSIKVLSNTLDKLPCPNVLSTYHGLYVAALPEGVNYKELSKAKHSKKTIGEFVYFSIQDEFGTIKTYPKGAYVLIGGNTSSVSARMVKE